jgi:hypothetical protein
MLIPLQLILHEADLTLPLTLGLVREGPCRHLATMAIERFDTLGLWRQPTAEVVLVGVSLYFIARCESIPPLRNTQLLLSPSCPSSRCSPPYPVHVLILTQHPTLQKKPDPSPTC